MMRARSQTSGDAESPWRATRARARSPVLQEKERKKLLWTNGFAAAIFFILFIVAVVYLVQRACTDQNHPVDYLPLFAGTYWAPEQSSTHQTYAPDVPVALLATFSFITACFHVVYATHSFGYLDMVARGNQSYRWIEYSLTASLMIVVIALVSGTEELNAQILMALMIAATMWLGDTIEKGLGMWRDTQDPRARQQVLTCTAAGWLLTLGAFAIIFANFGQLAAGSAEIPGAGKPPAFVYAIVIVLFLMFASFGLIQSADVWFALRGRDLPDHGARFEIAYTSDSIVSKTLLVVLLLSGIYARGSTEE